MQISRINLLKTLLFILSLIICIMLINFLLVPFSSLDGHFKELDYEESKGNIDIIILGSSQENDGFIPSIMSKELNMHCATMTPQGGLAKTSYFCLLDIGNRNNLKTAIIGWDLLDMFQTPPYIYPQSRMAQLSRTLLKRSKNNPQLQKEMLSVIGKQRYTFTFFKYAAFPENLTKIKEVLDTRKKASIPWTEENRIIDNEFIDLTKFPTKDYNLNDILNTSFNEKISEETIYYVKKIKDFCNRKNIKLYFISSPYPDLVIENLSCINDLIKYTKDFFRNEDITFIDAYDTNYFLTPTKNEFFRDCYGHHTGTSAIEYTKGVCRYLKSQNQ